jgi:hypothetical protein
MYRIDTGQARTDLYGIGKGAAQVLDLTPLREQSQLNQQQEFAKQSAKQKEKDARDADIMSNLSKMGQIKIMPKDQPMFAEKATALRDYVKNNHEKLTAGDTDANMQYQQLLGDYQTSAEMSKNFREAWEQRGLALAKEPNAYRPEAMEQHLNRASTEDAGNWNIDDSIYKKNLNYNDRVVGDLSTYAQKQAKDTPYGKTFTRQQANELIASDLENPELFDQAFYDFNKAKDKRGATNPVEYYQAVHAPKLVVNDSKAGPEWLSSGGGNSNKEPKIRTNYNKTGDSKGVLNWEYVSPPDNPYMTTSIGDVKPGIIHDDGENTYMEVMTKPTSDEPAKPMRLGYQETQDFVRLKLGTTLNELRKGQAPAHINNEVKDVSKSVEKGHQAAETARAGKTTPSDFNSKWAKLKKGESLVGPDGKTYIKK